MMKQFFVFFAAALLGVCAPACAVRSRIVISESGEKASFFQTRSDAYGRVMLDLSGGVDEICYRHFSIRNPHDPRFAVFVAENTPDLAQWRLSKAPRHVSFLAKVARDRIPFVVRDNAELLDYYKRLCKNNPFIIRSSVDMTERDGQQVVSFQTRIRKPEEGILILTSGFSSLDPVDPDFVIEASCVISGYENELGAPEFKDLDRVFLDSVRLDNPE